MISARSAARSFGAIAVVSAVAIGVSVSGVARADDECPLGSVQKIGERRDLVRAHGLRRRHAVPDRVALSAGAPVRGDRHAAPKRPARRATPASGSSSDSAAASTSRARSERRAPTRVDASRARRPSARTCCPRRPPAQARERHPRARRPTRRRRHAAAASSAASTGDLGGAALSLLGVAVIATRRRSRGRPADRR